MHCSVGRCFRIEAQPRYMSDFYFNRGTLLTLGVPIWWEWRIQFELMVYVVVYVSALLASFSESLWKSSHDAGLLGARPNSMIHQSLSRPESDSDLVPMYHLQNVIFIAKLYSNRMLIDSWWSSRTRLRNIGFFKTSLQSVTRQFYTQICLKIWLDQVDKPRSGRRKNKETFHIYTFFPTSRGWGSYSPELTVLTGRSELDILGLAGRS